MINIFKHRIDGVVGIHFDGEKIFLLKLELRETVGDISQIVESDEVVDVEYVFEVDRKQERWTLIDSLETPFEAHDDESSLRAEALAEKVSALCSTRGWSTSVTALCLERNRVVIESEDLSSVPNSELDNAVRYRIAAAGNFDIDNFYSAHLELDGRVWMEGISFADARVWLEAWRKNEAGLSALTAMPAGVDPTDGIELNGVELSEGMSSALFAARTVALQAPPNFLASEIKKLVGWDFRKFAAAIAAVTLIGLTILFGLDRWEYSRAYDELAIEKTELDDLERDRRMKAFIERDLETLGERRQLLATLSKEMFPWRSVLVHFGAFHVKGVWIKEMRGAADKSIELKCEAVGYEAMSEFIKKLEEDREFFRHAPEIKSSATTRDGLVEFTVRLPMI